MSERRIAPVLLKAVSRAVERATSGGRRELNADVVLIDDRAMARLAGRYRGCARPTDVLAFDYGDDPALMGEVAISLDTARRQARVRGVPLADELTLLCIHGLLHVRGLGDETDKDWRLMREMEFEELARAL